MYELRASLYRYTFMNTDMNQFKLGKDLTNIWACLSTRVRKMTAYHLRALLCWASSLAIEHISSKIYISPLH